MLDVLHWLPFQQRIIFRIGAMVWRCIPGLAPAYLRDLCCPPGTRGRSSIRSLEQRLRFVPFARISTTQARAFSVVGPSVWNGLLLSQRLLLRILSDTVFSSFLPCKGRERFCAVTLKGRNINLRNELILQAWFWVSEMLTALKGYILKSYTMV